MTGREHFARDGFVEYPGDALVARPPQVGGDARPVKVHVGRKCGRRGPMRQQPLLAAHLGQVQAEATELRRHRGQQVAAAAELFEVLSEEAVLKVICGRTLGETVEDVGGQNTHWGRPFVWRNTSEGTQLMPPPTSGPVRNASTEMTCTELLHGTRADQSSICDANRTNSTLEPTPSLA